MTPYPQKSFNYLKTSEFLELLSISSDYQNLDDWDSCWQPV